MCLKLTVIQVFLVTVAYMCELIQIMWQCLNLHLFINFLSTFLVNNCNHRNKISGIASVGVFFPENLKLDT